MSTGWIITLIAIAAVAGLLLNNFRAAARKRRPAPPKQHGPVLGGQPADYQAFIREGGRESFSGWH